MNKGERIKKEAQNYGPDTECLVQEALSLYEQEKNRRELLVRFLRHYSLEGGDTFGFMIEARKLIKKVEETCKQDLI